MRELLKTIGLLVVAGVLGAPLFLGFLAYCTMLAEWFGLGPTLP